MSEIKVTSLPNFFLPLWFVYFNFNIRFRGVIHEGLWRYVMQDNMSMESES